MKAFDARDGERCHHQRVAGGAASSRGREIKVALQRFDGHYQGIAIGLAGQSKATIAGARVTIDPTTLRVGGGTVRVAGVVNPAASNLTVDIAGLPLSLVDNFAPGSGVQGTLSAKAQVNGALANTLVQASYSGGSGIRIRRPETALLPALTLRHHVDGRPARHADRAAMRPAATPASRSRAAVRSRDAPPQFQVSVNGAIDLAPFSPALGLSVRNVTGTLRPDLTLNIGNTITGSGTIALANATMSMPDAGTKLSGGEGLIALQGEPQIQRLRLRPRATGEVNVTGTVQLDSGAGFPGRSCGGEAAGGAAGEPARSRRHRVDRHQDHRLEPGTDSTSRARSPSTAPSCRSPPRRPPLSDHPGDGDQRRRPARSRQHAGQGAADAGRPGSRPTTACGWRWTWRARRRCSCAAAASMPSSAAAPVTGDPGAPAVPGGLTLRRGDFNLLGHRLAFKRGNVSLMTATTIEPLLDFAATTNVGADRRGRHHRHLARAQDRDHLLAAAPAGRGDGGDAVRRAVIERSARWRS